MTAKVLRKIEAELAQIVANAEDGVIDLFALGIVVRKIAMQAEMMEDGLGG